VRRPWSVDKDSTAPDNGLGTTDDSMNKKDFYPGLVFLLFTGAILVLILKSPSFHQESGPGPFFFPSISALLLGGLSLALLIKGARQAASGSEAGRGKRMLGRIIWIIMWSALYGATIEPLGYLLSTGVVTFALLAYFNRREWVFNISLSIITPVSIFILFDTLLKAPLPRGFLGF
jgi:putative tricarboxylic transport membrane protein